jgi:hypothetical protein
MTKVGAFTRLFLDCLAERRIQSPEQFFSARISTESTGKWGSVTGACLTSRAFRTYNRVQLSRADTTHRTKRVA